MPDVTPSRLAADVLAAVLCSPRSDEDATHGRLRVSTTDRSTVRALLPLLDDVALVEWVSEHGPPVPYRDYTGRLPCGLQLVVSTDAERVPLVDLVEGR